MLFPRIIPCLLIRDNGLVKTVKFKDGKYVGDPINAVKIFNEKEVDELIVLDIDATIKSKAPDYKMISNLAAECRMPMCYGGGVKTPQQASKVFALGVEKIALSSAIVEHPELIKDIAEQVGSQSVIAVLDVKKKLFGGYQIYTNNATKKAKFDILKFVEELECLGVGEIVLNSVDCDGMMQGYDIELVDMIKQNISVPVTVLGGAGSLEDIGGIINKYPIIGAAAGSLFVFKGKYKAVLINYPNYKEKEALIKAAISHI
ncbi:AglZ/HisF2 family acetamidino modification protein [Thiotrichales bacterium 19S9-12]|nr:AglZ/HisF2 family acetamidino modification protein [Thiotrichales bacterium 19S9-11]MCF6810962.1 AglZ/HisF2 family acetamidino modification protein [Thiotrichales bacterium 19S9-12]